MLMSWSNRCIVEVMDYALLQELCLKYLDNNAIDASMSYIRLRNHVKLRLWIDLVDQIRDLLYNVGFSLRWTFFNFVTDGFVGLIFLCKSF